MQIRNNVTNGIAGVSKEMSFHSLYLFPRSSISPHTRAIPFVTSRVQPRAPCRTQTPLPRHAGWARKRGQRGCAPRTMRRARRFKSSFEVRDCEIDNLVTLGLLDPAAGYHWDGGSRPCR